MEKPTYPKNHQIIHWLTAGLILISAPLAILMENQLLPRTFSRLQTHAVIGVIILGLTIVRLVLKFTHPDPPEPEGLPNWNKWLRRLVHWGWYLILILLGISGIMILIQSGEIPFLWGESNISPYPPFGKAPAYGLHTTLRNIVIGLFLLHIGGVLRHQFTKGNVLSRMGVNFIPTVKK